MRTDGKSILLVMLSLEPKVMFNRMVTKLGVWETGICLCRLNWMTEICETGASTWRSPERRASRDRINLQPAAGLQKEAEKLT